MAVNEDYLAYILDQLSEFGEVDTKKMFGGVGLYHQGIMFGLMGQGTFCLKADDTNRADYEAHGMKAFMSSAKKKGMPYYEVPVEILEDKTQLAQWTKKAFEVAVASKK